MTDASTEREVQRLREAMEQIVPDAAIRDLALQVIADSIAVADEGASRSWALAVISTGGLRLHLANRKVAEIGRRDVFYMLVDNSNPSPDVQTLIKELEQPNAQPFRDTPNVSRLLVPWDELATILPQIRADYDRLLKRIRDHKSGRPDEHSRIAQQYLMEETGRTLPIPSHSQPAPQVSSAVQNAMERAYPDPEVRRRVMNLLADSIELADQGVEGCWSLTLLIRQSIRLTVGSIASFRAGWHGANELPKLDSADFTSGSAEPFFSLTISTAPGVLSEESMRLAERFKSFQFKSPSDAISVGIPVGQMDELLPHVLPAHQAAIEQLRNWRSGTGDSFSAEAFDYIERETGRNLPVSPHMRSQHGVTGRELPSPADDGSSLPAWKLSVGGKASNLMLMVDQKVMALEFDSIGFDVSEGNPVTKEQFRSALEARGVAWDPAPNHGPLQLCALLFDVKPGDRVYLTYDKAVRASGVVVGDYEYDVEADTYRHRRRVDWTNLKTVATAGMSPTLKEKLETSYMALDSLTPQQADEIDGKVPPLVVNWKSAYQQLFVSEGLHYTPWQQAVFFTALQTKGFVILSGISGTGKTKIAQAFSAALPQPDAGRNVEFLTVRPDWRDSKSLLGYHNPITDRYEWTPFLRFLLRARASWEARDGLAWFVILDEMNLAHVEHYFAELLSVLESGRDADGWTREAIHLPSSGAEGSPPASLKLPPNLHIIGTVNLDETTHAFSPKVLDRAFAMELSDVSFTGFPFAIATGDSLSDAERDALLEAFSIGGTFPRIDQTAISARLIKDERPRDWLEALNRQLRPHHMHFGYRVFAEIMAFVDLGLNNDLFSGFSGSADALVTTFDAAVLMKVLPKFHGSRAKLEGPLTKVLGWCLNPAYPDTQTIAIAMNQAASPDALEAKLLELPYTFPETAHRAIRLLWSAQVEGFAAFG